MAVLTLQRLANLNCLRHEAMNQKFLLVTLAAVSNKNSADLWPLCCWMQHLQKEF